MVKNGSLAILNRISSRFREARKQHFWETFSLDEKSGLKILDVGGTPWSSFVSELKGHSVTYLNLDKCEQEIRDGLPEGQFYVQGDACDMPFEDGEFDIAFSNSVIEHVGRYSRQEQFANEIRRVSKAFLVQTPYRHFPIEPHYNFPFVQYFPEWAERIVYKCWPFSWLKIHKMDFERAFLLNRRQMRKLFPDAQLKVERAGLMVKSMTCVKQ